MIPADIEEAAQKRRGTPHLVLSIEAFEVENGRDAMDASSLAGDLQAAFGMLLGVDDEMADG